MYLGQGASHPLFGKAKQDDSQSFRTFFNDRRRWRDVFVERVGYVENKYALPSGKRLQFAIENCPIEIVDLPIKNGDFP